MKHKKLLLFLIVEMVVLGTLSALAILIPSFFTGMLAFPFEQLALAIGAVSRTGAVGNGLAVVLFAGISLVPVIIMLCYPREKEYRPERFALVALSAVLLPSLYGMINPGALRSGIPGGIDEFVRIIRSVFGITIWSALILFIVLRLIRLFRSGNRDQLLRYLRVLLCALCVYFVFQCALEMISVSMVAEKRIQCAADIFYLLVCLAAAVIPVLFEITVCFRMLTLLDYTDGESEELAAAAGRLSRVSCMSIAVTAGLTALKYILQLILMPYLSEIDAYAEIPVVSIFIVLVILLFSRLLTENRQLREDISLFI